MLEVLEVVVVSVLVVDVVSLLVEVVPPAPPVLVVPLWVVASSSSPMPPLFEPVAQAPRTQKGSKTANSRVVRTRASWIFGDPPR